jgi:hypothetical protein
MNETKQSVLVRSQTKAQLTRPAKDAYDRFGNLSTQEKILEMIKHHTEFLIMDNFDKKRSRYHIIKLEILKVMLEEEMKVKND